MNIFQYFTISLAFPYYTADFQKYFFRFDEGRKKLDLQFHFLLSGKET